MGIELHFHGDVFAPRFGNSDETESSTASRDDDYGTDDDEEESGGGAKTGAGALLALILLFGIALAVRKFRGGGEPVGP